MIKKKKNMSTIRVSHSVQKVASTCLVVQLISQSGFRLPGPGYPYELLASTAFSLLVLASLYPTRSKCGAVKLVPSSEHPQNDLRRVCVLGD